jgi:hypothetical protein
MYRTKSFLEKECFRGFLIFNPGINAMIIFLVTFFILFLFKPFLFSEIKSFYTLILSLGVGLIAVWAYCLTYVTFKPFSKKKWTNFDELVTHTLTISLVWVCSYFYIRLCFEHLFTIMFSEKLSYRLPEYFFYESFWQITATGCLIYMFVRFCDIYLSHTVLKNKWSSLNEPAEMMIDQKLKSNVILKGKNKNEEIRIPKELIICIQSSGHYAHIFYMDKNNNNKLSKRVFRTSLKDLELQTCEYPFLYRCHNSFIINKTLINHVRGNLTKSFVRIKNYPKPIPVSKNKIKYMKSLQL